MSQSRSNYYEHQVYSCPTSKSMKYKREIKIKYNESRSIYVNDRFKGSYKDISSNKEYNEL